VTSGGAPETVTGLQASPGRPNPGLDLRLVWPAAAGWASAGLLVASPSMAGAVAGGLAVLAGVLVALAVRYRDASARPRRGHRAGPVASTVAVCCAAAALAALSVAMQDPVRLPDAVRTIMSGDEARGAVTVRLTVVSATVPSTRSAFGGADQVRFRATLTGIEATSPAAGMAAATAGLSSPVLVFAEAGTTEPAIGDAVRVSGSLVATDPADAAVALLFGRGPIENIGTAPWWLDWANALRAGFAGAAESLPGAGGGLLPGLAIGDTTMVSEDLDASMKTSSLSHLTAVSGANCAIVLALALMITAACGLGKVWRVGVALGVLAGFVVLVTPEPSVVRAATMATIVLLAGATGRPGLCLLVADPWLSRNYGFVLSVLATLGLLVLTVPLSRWLGRWVPGPVAAMLAIPLAAQLACQPVLVLLSPTLPVYGVPANLLAGPAAPVASIAGLATCLVLPWLPWLGHFLMWLAWLPATWIAAVAEACANLPGSRLPWLDGPLGVLLTLACTIAVLVLIPATRPGRSGVVLRILSGGLLCLAAGGTVGALVGTGLGRAVTFPADWQIAACDIGQGDAVLVRDGDQVALIDVGPDAALLKRCLDTLGIDRLNLLVLTHYDLDHVGGLDAVLGRVDTALVGPPENAQDARLHADLAGGGATITEAARGDRGILGGLTWRVLWPIEDAEVFSTGNAGSVSMLFEGNGIRSVFLGDLDEAAQSALLTTGAIGRVDVVKVAHHGSGDQSPALYAQIRASVGLISVGADNGYGHPTRSLVRMLGAAGTAIVRTDRDGLSVVAPVATPSTRGAATPSESGRTEAALRVWTEKVTGAG
jgi:competence protein ComEC